MSNIPTALWVVLILLILFSAVGLGFWAVGVAIKITLYVILALVLIWIVTALLKKIRSNV